MILCTSVLSQLWYVQNSQRKKKIHCSEPIGITHCHDKRIGGARNCKSFKASSNEADRKQTAMPTLLELT